MELTIISPIFGFQEVIKYDVRNHGDIYAMQTLLDRLKKRDSRVNYRQLMTALCQSNPELAHEMDPELAHEMDPDFIASKQVVCRAD